MQLVVDSNPETLDCDKVITTKSLIVFHNMNATEDAVNGDDFTNSSVPETENFESKSPAAENSVDKFIENNKNPSTTSTSDDGNSNQENDENCNHLDMETDPQESPSKNEDIDPQLNTTETTHSLNGISDTTSEQSDKCNNVDYNKDKETSNCNKNDTKALDSTYPERPSVSESCELEAALINSENEHCTNSTDLPGIENIQSIIDNLTNDILNLGPETEDIDTSTVKTECIKKEIDSEDTTTLGDKPMSDCDINVKTEIDSMFLSEITNNIKQERDDNENSQLSPTVDTIQVDKNSASTNNIVDENSTSTCIVNNHNSEPSVILEGDVTNSIAVVEVQSSHIQASIDKDVDLQRNVEKSSSSENTVEKDSSKIDGISTINSVESMDVDTTLSSKSDITKDLTTNKNDAMVFIENNILNNFDQDMEGFFHNKEAAADNGNNNENNTSNIIKDSDKNKNHRRNSHIIDTLDLLCSDDEGEKSQCVPETVSEVTTGSDDIISDSTLDSDKVNDLGPTDGSSKPVPDNICTVVSDSCDSTKIIENSKETLAEKPDSILVIDDEDPNSKNGLEVRNPSETKKAETNAPTCLKITDLQKILGSGENKGEETIHPESATPKPVVVVPPIITPNVLLNFKSNLQNMTRENLEEFCLVKIVEAIIKSSNLSEAEAKLKAQAKNTEILRKTLAVVTKQNRDLEIVMRNLTSEHNRRKKELLEPVKISRSVGFQVGNSTLKTKVLKPPCPSNNDPVKPPAKPLQKKDTNSLLAAHLTAKPTNKQPVNNPNGTKKNPIGRPKQFKPAKPPGSSPKPNNNNNLNNSNGANKVAEKRPLDTSIDLTDDEPPAKVPNMINAQTKKNQQNCVPQRLSFVVRPAGTVQNNFISKQLVVNPRSYTPQGSTVMTNVTISPNTNYSIPIIRAVGNNNIQRSAAPPALRKHPAPLPSSPTSKIPNNPAWIAPPPKPQLRISRVSNGIVISWIMETELDRRFEPIASYQIFAYQETTLPAQSELWKKIGDVKALPLPMACTLTQFITGYKYYFAVRAVDVRSRVGPFSTPESIILQK